MNEQDVPGVGLCLRALRQERSLSLRALAELCGLSPNTISLIERGISSPTVSSLHRLASALGVPISRFFADRAEFANVLLTPAGERGRSGSICVVLESLGHGLREQACDPFVATLKRRAGCCRRMMAHSGHELVYCLGGELDYEVAGEDYRLVPGDALLFHATLPHRCRNPGDRLARFLLIMMASEDRAGSVEQHLHP